MWWSSYYWIYKYFMLKPGSHYPIQSLLKELWAPRSSMSLNKKERKLCYYGAKCSISPIVDFILVPYGCVTRIPLNLLGRAWASPTVVMWMVISCDHAFEPCPQGIMHMRQPYDLMNWCEVITFCMTPTQQLKTMDQAERTQESECGSRARPEETPEQREQRLARWREQYRECRARATARAFLRL